MLLTMNRCIATDSTTISTISIGCSFVCFALEDGEAVPRELLKGRIPAGTYDVRLRECPTPLTDKYRKKFPSFFSWHLEIRNIPNFTDVYFHIGNSCADTAGCVLVGNSVYQAAGNLYLGDSTVGYTEFYLLLMAAFDRGERVVLQIIETLRS
jgi:hypothetical protein